MKLIVVAVATLVLLAAPARAEPASADASARRLELSERYFKALHLETNYIALMKSMLPILMAGRAPAQSGEALEETFRAVIDEVMPQMIKDMEAIMVPACAEIFTEEELAGLVGFYESPAGQSLVVKTPQLSARTSPEMAKLMPKYQVLFVERLLERLCAEGACGPDKTPARTPS